MDTLEIKNHSHCFESCYKLVNNAEGRYILLMDEVVSLYR